MATRNEVYYRQVKEVIESEGFHVRRAYDGNGAARTARKHLADVAIIDIDIVGTERALKGIKDVFALSTRIILCYESDEWYSAKPHLNGGFADVGLAHPISEREIENVLDETPEDPGFAGDCRVTFIDPVADLEHQTPHGAAAPVSSPEFDAAVVLGEHVPDWVDDTHTEAVIGRDGDLLTAFDVRSVDSESGHEYGIGEQYWFSEKEF